MKDAPATPPAPPPPPPMDPGVFAAMLEEIVTRRVKDLMASRTVDERFDEEMAKARGTDRPPMHEALVECVSPVTGATFTARSLMPRGPGGTWRVKELLDYAPPDGWDRHIDDGGRVPNGTEIRGPNGEITLRFGAAANKEYYVRDNWDVCGKPLSPQYRRDYVTAPGSVVLTPEQMAKLGITRRTSKRPSKVARPPELPPSSGTTTAQMDQRYPPTITYDEATRVVEEQAGPGAIVRNDPAFAPEGDPVLVPGVKATAGVVYRSNPLIVVQNSWTVEGARAALVAHMNGSFERSAQLADSLVGDDRVTATLGSLRAGYFGREVRSKPANDSRAAKEVHDSFMDHWPQFEARSDMGLIADYERLMGFADAQLVWDTSRPVWRPYLRHWHARYQYWHWDLRKMIALSQDGQIPIIPGNGKWAHHSRFGYERCWIRGAVRPIAEPYLGRHWAYRDWCRWSEKHGLPAEICETPMSADPTERSQFVQSVANRGSEATILIGKGVDKDSSYDYRLVEATDGSWEGFPGLRSTSDVAIVLALMFQNLTTEVNEGALASTSAHMDIRDAGIQDDNGAWRMTIHDDVARPFAFFNFGDPDLAPWVERDVASRAQYDANGKKFQAFGTAMQAFSAAGIKFNDEAEVRMFAADKFGLDGMPAFTIGDPPSKGGSGGGGFDGFGKT